MAIRNIDKVNRIKALAAKAVKNKNNSWFLEKFTGELHEFMTTYGDHDIIEAATKDSKFRENYAQAVVRADGIVTT